MFHGTTIDDLLNIVERAEEHARTNDVTMETKPAEAIPAFMFEMMNHQVLHGVA